MSTSRARTALLVVSVVLVTAMVTLLAPWPARLGQQRTGDPALAARAARLAGPDQRRGIAVAVVDHGQLTTAELGSASPGRAVRPDTRFEIGSVTKTLTAAVLADMVADGTVGPQDRLREVLPDRRWTGSLGEITLAELAGQRSGLPTVRRSFGSFARASLARLTGANPYRSVDIFAEANAATGQATAPGNYEYSNLGFALLGAVLAEKAGQPYPELLRARVLAPLGMSATTLPTTAAGPPENAAQGHDVTGRAVASWIAPGWTAAGAGVWSTVGDLATYADATMRGRAPGADATRPRWPAGDAGRIGYAWMSTPIDGRTVVWHNGGAGGATSFVGFDRAQDRVVAVLSNTDLPVDAIGRGLLGAAVEPDSAPAPPRAVGIAVAFPLLAALSFLAAARGGWQRRPNRRGNRLAVIGAAGVSVFFLTVAYGVGVSGWLLTAVWPLAGIVLGVGAFVVATRWPSLPWRDDRGQTKQWLSAGFGLFLGLFAVAATTGLLS